MSIRAVSNGTYLVGFSALRDSVWRELVGTILGTRNAMIWCCGHMYLEGLPEGLCAVNQAKRWENVQRGRLFQLGFPLLASV